jgi:hypothetical protein
MCDIPTTYKEALNSIVELESNYRRHEKSMATAKAKLDAAKAIVLEHVVGPNSDPGQKFVVPCKGGEISIGVARETKKLDNFAVGNALEEVDEGLSLRLAMYSITDVRKYLAPIQIDKLSEASFGARLFKVKEVS